MDTTIAKVVRMVGGQSTLAEAIQDRHPNIRQQHVWRWLRSGRVPAEYVLAIEAATNGKVTRYELRPDVFGPDPAAVPRHRRATDQLEERAA